MKKNGIICLETDISVLFNSGEALIIDRIKC